MALLLLLSLLSLGVLTLQIRATFKVHTNNDDFGSLRFEGGDLAVILGNGDTLILHSSVLKEASPFFNAGLSAKWTKGVESITIIDSGTKEAVPLFGYKLYLHDGIYSLHTKVRCCQLSYGWETNQGSRSLNRIIRGQPKSMSQNTA